MEWVDGRFEAIPKNLLITLTIPEKRAEQTGLILVSLDLTPAVGANGLGSSRDLQR